MKKKTLNQHTINWVLHWALNWKLHRNKKGSILIWTVLMGFLLTSTFFFFGMRQRKAITVQRDTATILNTKSYLKSYANYLIAQTKSVGTPPTLIEGVNGKITKLTDTITGAVDIDEPVTYKFAQTVKIKWNKCSNNHKANLTINGIIFTHESSSECGPEDDGYDDQKTLATTNPFTLNTANTPYYYQIEGIDMTDNKWNLEISTDLDYGKTVKVRKTFDLK